MSWRDLHFLRMLRLRILIGAPREKDDGGKHI